MKSRILLTAIFILGLPANALACGAYPAGTNANDLVLGMVANGSNIVTHSSIANAGTSRQGMLVYNRTNNTLHLCNGGSWITLSASAGVSAAGSTGQVQFNNAGVLGADSNLFWDNTNKRLGIATAAPAKKLHVVDNTVVIGNPTIRLEGATAGYGAGVEAGAPLTGGSYLSMGKIVWDGENSWNTTTSTQDSYLTLHTTQDGTVSERMRITSAGNIGLGTTTPGAKLDVNGSVRFDGVDELNWSGYVQGNQSVAVTFSHNNQASFEITAVMNHYGHINTYGCARKALVANGSGTMDVVNIVNVSSANGGSWTITRNSATSVTITKTAGSYVGGGDYFISVRGAQSLVK